jgi:hypothetical protein
MAGTPGNNGKGIAGHFGMTGDYPLLPSASPGAGVSGAEYRDRSGVTYDR